VTVVEEDVKARKSLYGWMIGLMTWLVLSTVWPASQEFANHIVKVVLDFFHSF
jgi:hypothetical protein